MAVVEGVEILLVEDSEDDAELTMRAIRNNKIANRIELVRDGVEALAYLESDRPLPRLVLLDLKLPRMNGLDVLRRIRGNPRTRVLPIVVLTSSREEPDIAAAYELGVNSYIVKPVEFDDFVKAVTDAGLYWLLLNEPPTECPVTTRVLLVEDNPSDADLVELAVRRAVPDLVTRQVQTEAEFLQQLKEFAPDLVISDHKLPQFSGARALELDPPRQPDRPFLLVTGSIDEETAVEYMKAGATDYLLKDRTARLGAAVLAALKQVAAAKCAQHAAAPAAEGDRYRSQHDLRQGFRWPLHAGQSGGGGDLCLHGRGPAGQDRRRLQSQQGGSRTLPPERPSRSWNRASRKFIAEEPVTNPSTGTTRWFQTIKVPLSLPGHDMQMMLGVGTDITAPEKPGGAASPVAENGSGRAAGRRHRP